MAALYDSTDTLIASDVTAVIPGYDTIKVINRLLSGQFHVQTIGTPARVCSVSLIVTSEAAKNTIDVAEGAAESVKVTGSGKYYTGVIREAPSWGRLGPDRYQTTITLLVSAEGVV